MIPITDIRHSKAVPLSVYESQKVGLGFGMFTLRAAAREEVESIVFKVPCTIAEIRNGVLIWRQRTEGDIRIRTSFTNGSMQIGRRSFVFGGA